MPCPAGTVGHGPNGTMIAGSGPAWLDAAGGLAAGKGRVERGKEPVGGGLALAIGAPHHATLVVIADQRQVLMALAPRDLVHRDVEQIVEPVGWQQLLADALDDPRDRLPVDPQQPAGRRPVGLGQQPRDKSSKSRVKRAPSRANGTPSTCTPCSGQRNRLSRHGSPSARRPRSTAATPSRGAARSHAPSSNTSTSGNEPLAPQRDPDHHPARLEADLLDPHPRQVQQAGECGSDAHSGRPPVRRHRQPRTYGLTSCASLPHPATSGTPHRPWAFFAGIHAGERPLTQAASSSRKQGEKHRSQPRTAYTALWDQRKPCSGRPLQALSHLRSSTEPQSGRAQPVVATTVLLT